MIDAHQHLFYPDRFAYSWVNNFSALQGAFHLEAYCEAAANCGIDGTLFMEVDVDEGQAAAEAAFFCGLAEDRRHKILGVIASARPETEGFEAHLDTIFHEKVKGIRRVLHTQPDELSQSDRFRRNVARLSEHNLTFDLCVLERQLPLGIELVDACPDTLFILDHCGIPDIGSNSLEPWRAYIAELAHRPNVACKVSGLLLYASEAQRTASGIYPWFSHVVDSFGWDRLLWGGDWPVCTIAAPLQTWVQVTHELLDKISATSSQRSGFLEANAKKIYRL